MSEVQHEKYNVSAAHPDKIVVNGVDLVNRAQLSQSQNRELQRYIDSHSHLLGFYDKNKEEKEQKPDPPAGGRYNSLSLSRLPPSSYSHNYDGSSRNLNLLNRIGSPSSEYGGKRKGVSFADGVDSQRARSHSPTYDARSGAYADPYDNNGYANRGNSYSSRRYGQPNGNGDHNRHGHSGGAGSNMVNNGYGIGGAGGASNDRRGQPSRQNSDSIGRRRTESPNAPFKWAPYQSYEGNYEQRNTVAPPYPSWLKDRSQTPAYSTLERHKDDYNPFGSSRSRSSKLPLSIKEKDEEIKFSSYGDRVGSGIELTRKRWTGGETVTDPNFIKKSLKPRRMYYSPIGDGVVAADGVELKRGPPDLSPRIYVTHERVVEHGDPGSVGRRVYENTWDTGNRGDGYNDSGRGDRNGGPDNLGDGGNPYKNGSRGTYNVPYNGLYNRPYSEDPISGGGLGDGGLGDGGDPNAGRGSGPLFDDDWPKLGRSASQDPYGTLGSGDGYPRSDRATPLSLRSDGFPREGWTRTFITNPRELINQYGTETTTAIFDLEDHTPKTYTTIKETLVPENVPRSS